MTVATGAVEAGAEVEEKKVASGVTTSSQTAETAATEAEATTTDTEVAAKEATAAAVETMEAVAEEALTATGTTARATVALTRAAGLQEETSELPRPIGSEYLIKG